MESGCCLLLLYCHSSLDSQYGGYVPSHCYLVCPPLRLILQAFSSNMATDLLTSVSHLCRLIVLLTLLGFFLLSNRFYNKHQHRSQAGQNPLPTHSQVPPGGQIVPVTIVRTPSGLRLTPSPGGDTIVTIPPGLEIWNPGRSTVGTRPRTRDWEGNTPSVWGIDLDRGLGGGVRGGTAGVVISSIILEPTRWGGRRAVDDENGVGDEVEGLPRYEEPPPGYEKVMEEGRLRLAQLGEAGEGSRDAPGVNISGGILGGERVQIGGEPSSRSGLDEDVQVPTRPDPAVTRSRPVTST